jgi:hypothetical protein
MRRLKRIDLSTWLWTSRSFCSFVCGFGVSDHGRTRTARRAGRLPPQRGGRSAGTKRPTYVGMSNVAPDCHTVPYTGRFIAGHFGLAAGDCLSDGFGRARTGMLPHEKRACQGGRALIYGQPDDPMVKEKKANHPFRCCTPFLTCLATKSLVVVPARRGRVVGKGFPHGVACDLLPGLCSRRRCASLPQLDATG